MRFSIAAAALLAATALSACGHQGNPNGSPYADEPGGALAVKPEVLGTVSYDPYAPAPAFSAMQMGQPAINPPPPLNIKPVR